MKYLLLVTITILAVGCGGKDESTTETKPVEEKVLEVKEKVKTEESIAETKPKPEGVNSNELEFRDLLNETVYLKGSLYTGKSFSLQVNGKKRTEGSYVDGKKDGLWIEWNDDGQKQSEDNYKKGKYNGLRIGWHPNGQKSMEGTWINDEAEGVQVWWHPNGQKKCVENIEKGKRISAAKYWNNKGEPVNSFAEANKQ
tara:strand:+ start:492 stop:1085 length:594 start_codon:yes stop_codon:yes gene_type:complete